MHENKLILIILFLSALNISCQEVVPALLPDGISSCFSERDGNNRRYPHKLVKPIFERCGLEQADQDSWGEYINSGKKISAVMGQIDRQAKEDSLKAELGERLARQIATLNKAACVYVGLKYEKNDAQLMAEEEGSVKKGIAKEIAPALYRLGCKIETAQTSAELADRLEAVFISDIHNALFKQQELAKEEASQFDQFLRCIRTVNRLERGSLSGRSIAYCYNDVREDWILGRVFLFARDLEKTGERVALNDCNSLIDLLKLLEKKQSEACQIALNPASIVKARFAAESSYSQVIKHQYSQRAAFYRCAIDHINKQASSTQLGDECSGWLAKEDREDWFGRTMPKHLQDTYERVTR